MRTSTFCLLAGGLALGSLRAASAQVLYDDFESTRLLTYGYVDGTLTAVANPAPDAVNGSAKCARYDRSAAQYAVVLMSPTGAHLADVSAYTAGTKKLSMKFRSPGPGTAIQLVLQNKTKAAVNVYPKGNFGGTFDATAAAAAGAWETLTFAYTANPGGADPTVTATTVDQLVMLLAPNTTTAATYYYDDLRGPELTPGALAPQATAVLLDNFENTRLVDYPGIQGTLSVVANPGSSTSNSSATCGSFARDGSQQYATLTIAPKSSGKFGDVSGFADGSQKLTMKFRSPAAGTKVQLVLQNKAKASATPYAYPQGNFGGTFDATTGATANTWETLTFAYTANAGGADATVTATDIDQLAVLIAPGTTLGSTYYFDDFTGPSLAVVTATRTAHTSTAAFSSPYPNPTTGEATHLPFSLKQPATVSLAVYDALGRRASQVLETQAYPAGEFAADVPTTQLAPGLYTCRLVVDGAVLTRQLSVH